MSPFALLLTALLADPAAAEGRLRAAADPRFELDAVLDLLAGPRAGAPLLPRNDYAREALLRFSPWREHPAVRRRRERGRHPALQQRHTVLAQLSPPPELAPREPLPPGIVAAAGGEEAVRGWLEDLRDFARDSGFLGDFPARAEALRPARERFELWLSSVDALGAFERYTGRPFAGEYLLVLLPFYGYQAEVNTLLPRADGGSDIVSTIWPNRRSGESDFRGEEHLRTLWHELGHAATDPLCALFLDDIQARPIPIAKIPGGCYQDRAQCVREHMARAVMARLLALRLGVRAAKRLRRDPRSHFPYLPAILERLERDYEPARERYPALADFFPRLLEELPPTPAP